jgi:tRNA(adenine34) deaminase
MTDEQAMELALDQARAAQQAGDIPVGAVVLIDGEVIGTGRNERHLSGDPTAHAEVMALRAAAGHIGDWHLDKATLVVTLEPCPMCAGAIVNARIARVVFGAHDPKAGAAGTHYMIPADPRLNHQAEVVSGVMGDVCAQLLTDFFTDLRS